MLTYSFYILMHTCQNKYVVYIFHKHKCYTVWQWNVISPTFWYTILPKLNQNLKSRHFTVYMCIFYMHILCIWIHFCGHDYMCVCVCDNAIFGLFYRRKGLPIAKKKLTWTCLLINLVYTWEAEPFCPHKGQTSPLHTGNDGKQGYV